MEIIKVGNLDVKVISKSSTKYAGRNGRTVILTIECVLCGEPKTAHLGNVLRGISLSHSACAVRARYERTRNTKEKQIQFLVSRSHRVYKKNAEIKGREFSLEHQDVENLIFQDCFYCGSPPEQLHGKYTIPYTGIDRIDSRIGYVLSNCVPCCHTCNTAKMDMSTNNFLEWIKRVYEFQTRK
jgi:hypothetical protein